MVEHIIIGESITRNKDSENVLAQLVGPYLKKNHVPTQQRNSQPASN